MIVGQQITCNEDDILEVSVRHMLAECDWVWVEDRCSTDCTPLILARMVDEYGDRLVVSASDRRPSTARQTELTDELVARGATWVVPWSTDEIWYANGGTLREVLPTVDADHVLAAVWEHRRLPTDIDADPFGAMRWRYSAPWDWTKVAVRADLGVRAGIGTHLAEGGTRPYSGDKIGVRHFPWRTPSQARRRLVRNAADSGSELPAHQADAARTLALWDCGELDAWWAAMAEDPDVVDDPAPIRCD